ncbi:MAG: nucleotidyl transferase AbiEii/AbiGii toxin family protein [Candidatus Thorarchaeota archaeon]|nr:MAG: hypothetical protein DRP09_03120 [Candidatus Thorarchaeota archaeon]RLI59818.1 MAG: hypothetical protein DRO87_01675 [Candidatus Thorarchaeota archaeon]
MKALKQILMERARQIPGGLPIIEKDYAIGHIIAGMMEQQTLRSTLVMKGGTALRRLYFGNYRLSEDLDFTGIAAPNGKDMLREMSEACQTMEDLLQNVGRFSFSVKRVEHKTPHPTGQEEFKVRVQFPWHDSPSQSVKIEVSHGEPVLLDPLVLQMIDLYDEDLSVKVKCYRLEEIVAEKLRASLQIAKHRMQRGWARPRGRDIYDIWRILVERQTEIDLHGLPDILRKKCDVQNVRFTSLDDFFTVDRVEEVRQSWTSDVGRFVSDLPKFNDLLAEVKEILTRVF